MSEPEDFVVCRICDDKFQWITHGHLRGHDMTYEEYQNEFPESSMISEKFRKKLIVSSTGKNNPMYGMTGEKSPTFGKIHTEEAKAKMRAARIGMTFSHTEETRAKISASHMGKRHSEETKAKLSAISMGTKNPNFGKTPSEEIKAKISASHMGKTCSEEHKAKIRAAWTADKRVEWSISRIGESNPNWNNGSSFEPYCPAFNEERREHIRNLCNRTCTICEKSTLQNKRRLSVDHTDENKMQGCDNWGWRLTSLCSSCHARMNNQTRHLLLQLLLFNNKRHQTNFLFGDE